MKRLFIYTFFSFWFSIMNGHAKPLIVYFDWSFNPHHAPLIIAQQKGIFKKHGIEVRLVSASGSEEGSNQVAQGNVDIAVSKQSSHLVRVVNQQLPLVRIATLIDRPLECLITSPSLSKIADLKGKKIGFTSSNIDFAIYSINTILKHNGVDPKSVTLVPIMGPMTPALVSNKVDAIFSAYRTYELAEVRQQIPGANVFYYEDNEIPSYEQSILVTHQKSLTRPEIKKFIQALRESCAFIKDHPQEAWQSYIAYMPQQNTPYNKELFFNLVPLFVKDPALLSIPKYESFADYLSRSDVLKSLVPPVSQYAVDLFAKD